MRTPVAPAGTAVWFASGESSLPGGIEFGSETMFMPHFKRRPAAVQPGRAPSVGVRRQVSVMREVAEPGKLTLELQFDGAGGAVALLADDDFGLAMHQRHVELPLLVFRRTDARLLVGEVIFLAEHEHDHVGVLFNRTGFAQVGQLRTLVVAAFDLTR